LEAEVLLQIQEMMEMPLHLIAYHPQVVEAEVVEQTEEMVDQAVEVEKILLIRTQEDLVIHLLLILHKVAMVVLLDHTHIQNSIQVLVGVEWVVLEQMQ